MHYKMKICKQGQFRHLENKYSCYLEEIQITKGKYGESTKLLFFLKVGKTHK